MMRRELIGLLGAWAGILALPGCNAFRPERHTFRFRMTVEVDTPQGLRSGYSVMEMSGSAALITLNGKTVDLNLVYEAVPIDLPGGQTLFMLGRYNLGGDNIFGQVLRGFDPVFRQSEALVALLAELAQPSSIGRVGVMTPGEYNPYPMLVRFRDANDPKTVELVDPKDLAKSFGKGVKLRRIYMTITDEPVTRTINKRLTWLGPYAESRLDRDYKGGIAVRDANLSQLLSYGDFRRGTEK